MGPGYFPMLLGGVLALLGVILVVRSLVIDGERVGRLHLLPLVVDRARRRAVRRPAPAARPRGLAGRWSIAVSALASRESRPLEVTVLALVLAAFSVGVFVYGLRLPLPVWPAL